MEYFSNAIKNLVKEGRDYIDTRMQLFKLNAVNKVSEIGSSIASTFIIGFIFFLFVIILSIGLGFLLGEITGKIYYGFFIVAAFYLLIGIIFYFLRHKLLKTCISNKIIKKINK